MSPPVNIPHNTVAVDPANPSAVYTGTDLGVWSTTDAGISWAHMGPETGMPNVPVFDVKINPPTKRTVAFTYGRGAFTLTSPLTLTASANQATVAVGQTLTLTVGAINPGASGTADFYAGFFKPDSTIEFFTSAGTVVGNLNDPKSFQSIAAGVSLAVPFSVTVPNFYSHQWTGVEPRGPWLFFLAALKGGALSDGVVTGDEVLALATVTFTVQ